MERGAGIRSWHLWWGGWPIVGGAGAPHNYRGDPKIGPSQLGSHREWHERNILRSPPYPQRSRTTLFGVERSVRRCSGRNCLTRNGNGPDARSHRYEPPMVGCSSCLDGLVRGLGAVIVGNAIPAYLRAVSRLRAASGRSPVQARQPASGQNSRPSNACRFRTERGGRWKGRSGRT
jgi:hypothetical protein